MSETVTVSPSLDGLPVLDLHDPEFWQDIHPDLGEARELSPVATDVDGAFWILRSREAEEILKDPSYVVADFMGALGLTEGPVWEWWQHLMVSKNPPEHTRIRRLVSRAFTPRAIDRLRPVVRATADSLLDVALDAPGLDVLGGPGLAHRLPSTVMAAMLGVPRADLDQFIDSTSDIGLAFGAATDPVVRTRVEAALAHLDEYVRDLILKRRDESSEATDLLGQLLAVDEHGDHLSTDEVVWLVENLLFAGHDTTRGAIAATLGLLAGHPGELAELRADPGLVDNAVEEILRFEPITFSTARAAGGDVEIGGVEIEAGSTILFCLPAISRDPRRYPDLDPEIFDVARPNPQPPTFGAGIHYCLGAALARVELQETLRCVLDRTSDFELVERRPRWVSFAYVRRYDRLPIVFTAR